MQNPLELLVTGRIVSSTDRIAVLTQELTSLTLRKSVQDDLRIPRVVFLNRLGTHAIKSGHPAYRGRLHTVRDRSVGGKIIGSTTYGRIWTDAAERAGHSVNVLLKVYAKCVEGQKDMINDRIQDALND